MAPNIRSEEQREEVYARIAQLRRRCYTQEDIAKELGLAQSQVCNYEKKLMERYRTQVLADTHEMVMEMKDQYMEVAMEAWRAWERSKEDAKRIVEEECLQMPKEGSNGNGSSSGSNGTNGRTKKRPAARMLKTKVLTTTEGRLPRSEYLRIVVDCLASVRDLVGLDAPKRLDVTQHVLDWTVLAQGLPEEIPDEVEERIREVLQLNMAKKERPERKEIEIGDNVQEVSPGGEGESESVGGVSEVLELGDIKPEDLRQE